MAVIVVVRTDPVVKERFGDGHKFSPATEPETGRRSLVVTSENGETVAEFVEWAYARTT